MLSINQLKSWIICFKEISGEFLQIVFQLPVVNILSVSLSVMSDYLQPQGL